MASACVSVGETDSESEYSDDMIGPENTTVRSGITDVIAKILNTAPEDSAILAKGSTDKQIKRKKKLKDKEGEGEIMKKKKKKSEDGASSSDWTDDSDEEASAKRRHQMEKRKEWQNLGRVKPNVLHKEHERMLQKIATRGVVQLFNAVRQQQSSIKEQMNEAGSSVRRRDKVGKSLSKKNFLDLLDSKQTKTAEDTSRTQDQAATEKWEVLGDSYLA
ncbi:hypothetical protein ACOMHN_035200 [Nucella lapillus]